MKKSTFLSIAAGIGCMFCGWQNASAETLMEPATLTYPGGYYASMLTGVSVSWDNQPLELVDPVTDEYGDTFVISYIQLDEGEQIPVNSYIMYSFGDPNNPDDPDIWNLELALWGIDDLFDFFEGDITVTFPKGIVKNAEGALNPEQKMVFHIMEPYTECTYTPATGSTLDENYVVKVSFGGNPIEYLQDAVVVYNNDPYTETQLELGQQVKITSSNEIEIDLSSFPSGDYEVVVPEGFVMVTVDGKKYLGGSGWLEYTLKNSGGSGIVSVEANGMINVYSVDGVKVMQTTDRKDFEQLPGGIYIINGKKLFIRK